MNTRKIHYFSGLFIAFYIGMHFFNHVTAIFGAETHIQVMHFLRHIYRNILFQPLLIAAIGIQIISGIRLFIISRKYAHGFFDQLHRWSGLYLAFFFLVHLLAIFMGRHVFHKDTNFYYTAKSFTIFPLAYILLPYYILGILAFFSHIASIHSKKMKRYFLGLSPQKQAIGILILGVIVTFLIFSGVYNNFHGVDFPEGYQKVSAIMQHS